MMERKAIKSPELMQRAELFCLQRSFSLVSLVRQGFHFVSYQRPTLFVHEHQFCRCQYPSEGPETLINGLIGAVAGFPHTVLVWTFFCVSKVFCSGGRKPFLAPPATLKFKVQHQCMLPAPSSTLPRAMGVLVMVNLQLP
jgi:hypothetical protein